MRVPFALAMIASMLLSFSGFAATPQATPVYREGVHYHVLPVPVAVDDPAKIEVTEVFWYGCRHCYHFEPLVLKWSKDLPDDINFVRIPAMWNNLMEIHARAFFVANELGIKDEMHQAIYNEIHRDPRALSSAESVADFFAEFGADRDAAIRLFRSAEATTYLQDVDSRARAYRITGTPQLIVHGRYKVEGKNGAQQSEIFDVVDFLVEKVRAEKPRQH
jgi:thiol:disulfide interchange protein DsbA